MSFTYSSLKTAIQNYVDNTETSFVSNLDNFIKTAEQTILNSIYDEKNIDSKSSELNISILNNLDFKNVDIKKFPSIKILNYIPKKNSLYETIIISANDQLVYHFLDGKIKFLDIVKKLLYIIKLKEFNKYKSISPKSFNEIKLLNNYVRLKVNSLCI